MVKVELIWDAEQPFAPGSTHTAMAVMTSQADVPRYFFVQLIFAGKSPNLGPMTLLLQPGETTELSKAIKMPNIEGEYPCQVLVLVYGPPPDTFSQDFYIDVETITIEGKPARKFKLWWLAVPVGLVGSVILLKRRK